MSNTVKELAKSMGSVQRQVKTVKDKQDKYESGWEDPYQDEMSYDGDSNYLDDDESIGAGPSFVGSEPPNKRRKQDGGGGRAQPSTNAQATTSRAGNGPITDQHDMGGGQSFPASNAQPSTDSHDVNDVNVNGNAGNKHGEQDHDTNKNNDSVLLGSMKKKFQMEETIGAPINSGLAHILDTMLSKGCGQDSLQNMTYARPANVEYLQKVKIDQTLWTTLNKTARVNDIRYQNIHESIVLGMLPLIEVTNACFNTVEYKTPLPTTKELFDKLKDSVAVLAHTCHEIGMTRRRALRNNVKEQYRSLCGSSNEVTTELFGDNLPSVTKDLGEMNKLANILGKDRGGFRGGNRFGYRRGGNRGGRGRGQDNFTPQQNSNGYRGRGGYGQRRSGFQRTRRGAV